MRVLALDYGAARCGCAVSDPTETLATPVDPVLRPASRKGLGRLVALARECGVGRIVVGLPLSLSGGDSSQTVETREFARRLQEALQGRIPVELYDERFTTSMAQRSGGQGSEDSRAAAHLLQEWLSRPAAGIVAAP